MKYGYRLDEKWKKGKKSPEGFRDCIRLTKKHFVHPEGFEPSTPRAEIWYSIQLNYGCSACANLMGLFENEKRRALF